MGDTDILMRINMKKLLVCLLVATSLSACQQRSTLPLMIKEVRDTLINDIRQQDTIYRSIPSFQFYNQDSVLISNRFFDGKIYVADFFFTSCPTICPVMHRHLLAVYQQFRKEEDVLFLSHSIDEKYDKPSRLKQYKRQLELEDERWQFVWGPKEKIYGIAKRDYLVFASEDQEAPGGYVHQGYFVLIDRQRRIRGVYDGTQKNEVQKLVKDIRLLLDEK